MGACWMQFPATRVQSAHTPDGASQEYELRGIHKELRRWAIEQSCKKRFATQRTNRALATAFIGEKTLICPSPRARVTPTTLTWRAKAFPNYFPIRILICSSAFRISLITHVCLATASSLGLDEEIADHPRLTGRILSGILWRSRCWRREIHGQHPFAPLSIARRCR